MKWRVRIFSAKLDWPPARDLARCEKFLGFTLRELSWTMDLCASVLA